MNRVFLATLAIAFGLSAAAAHAECLRSANLAHISMVSSKVAEARDNDGHRYRVTFTAACGARHVNAYFITKSEDMPLCLEHGVPLQTNLYGNCTIDNVTPVG